MHDVLERIRQQSEHGPAFPKGYCALAVRTVFEAPSSGDADHDDDDDAIDVWVRAQHKHHVDLSLIESGYRFPRAVPTLLGGGSEGHGHIVVTTGFGIGYNSKLWSVDIKRTGYFDLTTLGELLDWMVHPKLLGWVEDLGGKRVVAAA